MSILHRRPLVFVSSAIVGLEDIRDELHTRLVALDLVDDWVFEIHATAGGEPAEGQYLDVARRCDIDLLVVGDTRSQATEDEYAQAYADNPDKIIPIYLGDGSNDVKEFRHLIDGRHSREKASDRGELVDKAVAAVERAVLEGRLTARRLREGFEARLDGLDRLLDLEPGQSYLPKLAHGTAMVAPEILLEEFPRIAVTGIGGAGKTYGALVGLHRLSRIRRHSERGDKTMPNSVIPLYLRANVGSHALAELIGTAFTAVRFFPGSELTVQYARDGRLVLVIDGYDDLDATARNALIRDVETWSDAHPRSRVMFLARTLPDHALSQFARAQPAPLDLAQLAQLFAAHGQLLRGEQDIPPEVADLIRRPFWAGALARFGLDVRSGLELIGKVIDHRLDLASDGEASEAHRIRDALGELARSARPAIGLGIPRGLELISSWQGLEDVAARFEPIPANVLLDRLRNSGLVEPDGADLVFVHPLIAARLAAEATASGGRLSELEVEDSELVAFSAALLTELPRDVANEMK